MSNVLEIEMNKAPIEAYKAEVLKDYSLAYQSRQASLIGRKEVLTGKAKFGIFGDGKEVAQLAMAKVFEKGDYRSGYYRDQTFMFATGMNTIQQFFAQLYAHTDVNAEPNSAGRSMNGHFASRMLDEKGNWLTQADRYNSTADISPTAGQMPRLLGLALASKLYKNNSELHQYTNFSNKGNEVAFGTIGNASTSEGGFWEVMNAAGVLQVPMAMSVWDDGYGISVPARYQTTKENISEIMAGFQSNEKGQGIDIFIVKGWDYPELCQTYKKAIDHCRKNHRPVLIHVTEITQPQGHSTSGSHERYKSKERLEWEKENDCILKMRQWIIESHIASNNELEEIEKQGLDFVNQQRKAAWEAYLKPLQEIKNNALTLLNSWNHSHSIETSQKISSLKDPIQKEILALLHNLLFETIGEESVERNQIKNFSNSLIQESFEKYSSHLYSESEYSALKVKEIKATYNGDNLVDGREVVLACFDAALGKDARVFAFGEDVGAIGDVNQGFAGMQEKYGEIRVSDTGIRELSIIGQGIGAAMRGLRPIAEIQYLDYLLYALQIMSDDIATMQYRTKGGQKAPIIIRTRGHRLEGIWHSGSPMGMIIHAVRGMHVCVPRNMTQAAGMYNTLLQSDDPALVIECLNGYRLKENLPTNIGEFTVPLGVPEILSEGNDVTIISYGSTLRVIQEAMKKLEKVNIFCELIDVQTLLPFDVHQLIVESIKKTNKVVFIDEDVPGGATAFMMQQVLEKQNAFQYLDSSPLTIAAKEHRPAYGTDGDYFSKPNAENIFDAIYKMMNEYNPSKYLEF